MKKHVAGLCAILAALNSIACTQAVTHYETRTGYRTQYREVDKGVYLRSLLPGHPVVAADVSIDDDTSRQQAIEAAALLHDGSLVLNDSRAGTTHPFQSLVYIKRFSTSQVVIEEQWRTRMEAGWAETTIPVSALQAASITKGKVPGPACRFSGADHVLADAVVITGLTSAVQSVAIDGPDGARDKFSVSQVTLCVRDGATAFDVATKLNATVAALAFAPVGAPVGDDPEPGIIVSGPDTQECAQLAERGAIASAGVEKATFIDACQGMSRADYLCIRNAPDVTTTMTCNPVFRVVRLETYQEPYTYQERVVAQKDDDVANTAIIATAVIGLLLLVGLVVHCTTPPENEYEPSKC
jgi:hypothetical protein